MKSKKNIDQFLKTSNRDCGAVFNDGPAFWNLQNHQDDTLCKFHHQNHHQYKDYWEKENPSKYFDDFKIAQKKYTRGLRRYLPRWIMFIVVICIALFPEDRFWMLNESFTFENRVQRIVLRESIPAPLATVEPQKKLSRREFDNSNIKNKRYLKEILEETPDPTNNNSSSKIISKSQSRNDLEEIDELKDIKVEAYLMSGEQLVLKPDDYINLEDVINPYITNGIQSENLNVGVISYAENLEYGYILEDYEEPVIWNITQGSESSEFLMLWNNIMLFYRSPHGNETFFVIKKDDIIIIDDEEKSEWSSIFQTSENHYSEEKWSQKQKKNSRTDPFSNFFRSQPPSEQKELIFHTHAKFDMNYIHIWFVYLEFETENENKIVDSKKIGYMRVRKENYQVDIRLLVKFATEDDPFEKYSFLQHPDYIIVYKEGNSSILGKDAFINHISLKQGEVGVRPINPAQEFPDYLFFKKMYSLYEGRFSGDSTSSIQDWSTDFDFAITLYHGKPDESNFTEIIVYLWTISVNDTGSETLFSNSDFSRLDLFLQSSSSGNENFISNTPIIIQCKKSHVIENFRVNDTILIDSAYLTVIITEPCEEDDDQVVCHLIRKSPLINFDQNAASTIGDHFHIRIDNVKWSDISGWDLKNELLLHYVESENMQSISYSWKKIGYYSIRNRITKALSILYLSFFSSDYLISPLFFTKDQFNYFYESNKTINVFRDVSSVILIKALNISKEDSGKDNVINIRVESDTCSRILKSNNIMVYVKIYHNEDHMFKQLKVVLPSNDIVYYHGTFVAYSINEDRIFGSDVSISNIFSNHFPGDPNNWTFEYIFDNLHQIMVLIDYNEGKYKRSSLSIDTHNNSESSYYYNIQNDGSVFTQNILTEKDKINLNLTVVPKDEDFTIDTRILEIKDDILAFERTISKEVIGKDFPLKKIIKKTFIIWERSSATITMDTRFQIEHLVPDHEIEVDPLHEFEEFHAIKTSDCHYFITRNKTEYEDDSPLIIYFISGNSYNTTQSVNITLPHKVVDYKVLTVQTDCTITLLVSYDLNNNDDEYYGGLASASRRRRNRRKKYQNTDNIDDIDYPEYSNSDEYEQDSLPNDIVLIRFEEGKIITNKSLSRNLLFSDDSFSADSFSLVHSNELVIGGVKFHKKANKYLLFTFFIDLSTVTLRPIDRQFSANINKIISSIQNIWVFSRMLVIVTKTKVLGFHRTVVSWNSHTDISEATVTFPMYEFGSRTIKSSKWFLSNEVIAVHTHSGLFPNINEHIYVFKAYHPYTVLQRLWKAVELNKDKFKNMEVDNYFVVGIDLIIATKMINNKNSNLNSNSALADQSLSQGVILTTLQLYYLDFKLKAHFLEIPNEKINKKKIEAQSLINDINDGLFYNLDYQSSPHKAYKIVEEGNMDDSGNNNKNRPGVIYEKDSIISSEYPEKADFNRITGSYDFSINNFDITFSNKIGSQVVTKKGHGYRNNGDGRVIGSELYNSTIEIPLNVSMPLDSIINIEGLVTDFCITGDESENVIKYSDNSFQLEFVQNKTARLCQNLSEIYFSKDSLTSWGITIKDDKQLKSEIHFFTAGLQNVIDPTSPLDINNNSDINNSITDEDRLMHQILTFKIDERIYVEEYLFWVNIMSLERDEGNYGILIYQCLLSTEESIIKIVVFNRTTTSGGEPAKVFSFEILRGSFDRFSAHKLTSESLYLIKIFDRNTEMLSAYIVEISYNSNVSPTEGDRINRKKLFTLKKLFEEHWDFEISFEGRQEIIFMVTQDYEKLSGASKLRLLRFHKLKLTLRKTVIQNADGSTDMADLIEADTVICKFLTITDQYKFYCLATGGGVYLTVLYFQDNIIDSQDNQVSVVQIYKHNWKLPHWYRAAQADFSSKYIAVYAEWDSEYPTLAESRNFILIYKLNPTSLYDIETNQFPLYSIVQPGAKLGKKAGIAFIYPDLLLIRHRVENKIFSTYRIGPKEIKFKSTTDKKINDIKISYINREMLKTTVRLKYLINYKSAVDGSGGIEIVVLEVPLKYIMMAVLPVYIAVIVVYWRLKKNDTKKKKELEMMNLFYMQLRKDEDTIDNLSQYPDPAFHLTDEISIL